MFKIKVPATTSNMGAGFDCIGMALSLYNELIVEEADSFQIDVIKRQKIEIPTTKDNMIYKTITDFYAQIGKSVPPIKLTQNDYIPIARGLGSSAACIISGLLAANELSGQNLSRGELAQIACEIEKHPDNVTPAIYGGIIVGAMTESKVSYAKIIPLDEIAFAVLVPDFPLMTEQARGILPVTYSRDEAVFNISRAALFIASMTTGSWDNLATATDDRLHQPYRKKLVPNMDGIFEAAREYEAKGIFLSGAGPTIIAIIKKENENDFLRKMNGYLQTLNDKWEMSILVPDNEGAVLTHLGGNDV